METEEPRPDPPDPGGGAGPPSTPPPRRTREGTEELVLYVKNADRDYARYCTGWRPF